MRSPAADLPRPEAILFDLLMAVMNSLEAWVEAAQDREHGLAWRDAVARRMVANTSYVPYEGLVAEVAAEIGLAPGASEELWNRWSVMEPWPDASAIDQLTVPYAFVTNCSTALADVATRRSGLDPQFTLSAQGAGWYKPDGRIYREACRRLDRPIERVLFVAGSPYDADGARAAGLSVAQVARRPDQHRDEDSSRVVSSLREIVAVVERARGGWSKRNAGRLGFVLGPFLEEYLRRAMIISRGDPSIFVTRPISAVLLALAVGAVVLAVLPAVRKRRQVVFAEEDD